jgi:dTDP-4-dehydrorhamnose 3,5-epimerase
MLIESTAIHGVQIITPDAHYDDRGYFSEIYRACKFPHFVQDNIVSSRAGVLRGIHYNTEYPQGQLMMALYGIVHRVVIDVRKGSATFGKWVGVTLSADKRNMIYFPPGFAHGMYSLTDSKIFYKTTEYYDPDNGVNVIWNDADLMVDWHISQGGRGPILSVKDKLGKPFREVFG